MHLYLSTFSVITRPPSDNLIIPLYFTNKHNTRHRYSSDRQSGYQRNSLPGWNSEIDKNLVLTIRSGGHLVSIQRPKLSVKSMDFTLSLLSSCHCENHIKGSSTILKKQNILPQRTQSIFNKKGQSLCSHGLRKSTMKM